MLDADWGLVVQGAGLMQTYKCDVCNQDIIERFVVVIDNKEHDLCKFCKSETVGKIKNGRSCSCPHSVGSVTTIPTNDFTSGYFEERN